MAHACGEETVGEIVQRDPDALEIMKAAASAGIPPATLLAALNEGRKAPA